MASNWPRCIAHRGYAGIYPENTLEAFERAAGDDTTSMVELDVVPAADGTPMVFHDTSLEGERDGVSITALEGNVWDHDPAALARGAILGTRQGIPTLEAVFETLPADLGVNVELKHPGPGPSDSEWSIRPGAALEQPERETARDHWQPFVDRVLEVCGRFDRELLFSSFAEGALAALRAGDSSAPAAPLIWGDAEAGLDLADRYDCVAIHPPRNALVGTPLHEETYAGFGPGEPSIDLLEAAHESGRAVNVWTLETWVQVAQLRERGVDGLILEYPGLAGR